MCIESPCGEKWAFLLIQTNPHRTSQSQSLFNTGPVLLKPLIALFDVAGFTGEEHDLSAPKHRRGRGRHCLTRNSTLTWAPQLALSLSVPGPLSPWPFTPGERLPPPAPRWHTSVTDRCPVRCGVRRTARATWSKDLFKSSAFGAKTSSKTSSLDLVLFV